MKIDVTQILEAIIGLLSVLITGWLIPYLKSKTTKEHWETILSWAKPFVVCAEQIFKGAGRGAEKREYVLKCIREECKEHNISYSEAEIRAALENGWESLHSSIVEYRTAPETDKIAAEVSE